MRVIITVRKYLYSRYIYDAQEDCNKIIFVSHVLYRDFVADRRGISKANTNDISRRIFG